MGDNRLPTPEINALSPGNQVIFETYRSAWMGSEMLSGTVAKLTPKQVVVHYAGHNGTIEARFRREDGGRVGEYSGNLLDPTHPTTLDAIARQRKQARQRQIDDLAGRWSRERDNLDVLRNLQVAIGEYIDAEATP